MLILSSSRNFQISHLGLLTGKTNIFQRGKVKEREAEEEEDGKEDTRVYLKKCQNT